tara:strand:+ start:1616 stop:1762 length:147 start_codon:yes stop_codon:yes gene_type:complete
MKDKLKEIKKHREKKEELEGYMKNDLSTSTHSNIASDMFCENSLYKIY